MAKMESVRWGDAVENEEEDKKFFQQHETPVDEHGIKTVYEYPDGREKIIKKVQVKKQKVRRHPDVERRKNIKKFGECSGKPPGPEAGVTMVGDAVQIESFLTKKKVQAEATPQSVGILCRICGIVGDHWTPKCPYKEQLQAKSQVAAEEEPQPQTPSGGGGKYIPPGRNRGSEGGDGRSRQMDDPTVRVINLSEETKESDLFDLFSPFGPVKRVYLAKDKQTSLSKGFAFVTYQRREDAARAIEQLQGYGYDHLILHLEWARPAGY